MTNPQEQERSFNGKPLLQVSSTIGVEGETKSLVTNSLNRYSIKIDLLLETNPELKVLVDICKDYKRDLDRFVLGILENALVQISNGESLDVIADNLEKYFTIDDEEMRLSIEKGISGKHWFEFMSTIFRDLPKH